VIELILVFHDFSVRNGLLELLTPPFLMMSLNKDFFVLFFGAEV
jgi:hypothetical protein